MTIAFPPSTGYSGDAIFSDASIPANLRLTVTYSNRPPTEVAALATLRQTSSEQPSDVVYVCFASNESLQVNEPPKFSFTLPPGFALISDVYNLAIEQAGQWKTGYGGPAVVASTADATTVSLDGHSGFTIPANGKTCVALSVSNRSTSPVTLNLGAYLPAAAQSIQIALVKVNGRAPLPAPSPTTINVGAAAPECISASRAYTCPVDLVLPVGSDSVLVSVFDGASASGNLLSAQQSIFGVTASANNFSMTLDANPGRITITPPTGPQCFNAKCPEPPYTCSVSPLRCSILGISPLSGIAAPLSFAVTVADTHGTALANNLIAGSPVLYPTSSNLAVAKVSATQNPYAIIVTPVRAGTSTITVTANPATGTSGLGSTSSDVAITVTMPSLNDPRGIAVDASGNIYVGNYISNTVTKYSASGAGPLWTFSYGISGPQGVAVDASGNIYVANDSYQHNHSFLLVILHGTVVKYRPGGYDPFMTIDDRSYPPGGVAIDEKGNLYVANNSFIGGTVTKYTGSGEKIFTFNTPHFPSHAQHATGLAVDASGNIYVGDYPGDKVRKYASNGSGPILTISSEIRNPNGVAVDATGNIYVANFSNNTVTKYAGSGGSPILTISSGVGKPTGLALDTSGNIYVTNSSSNTVTKYAPTGGNPILTVY